MLDALFGGGQKKAGKEMEKTLQEALAGSRGYTQQATGYLQPFLGREEGIYNEYLNALRNAENPEQLYSRFLGSYRMSPEAQAQIQQGEQAANRAAAASGMLGSGAEQQAAASRAQAVRSQDLNNYLDRLYRTYEMGRGQYLGGLSGLQGQGFGAAQNIAQLLSGQGQSELQLYRDLANARAGQATGEAGGISNALGAGLGILGSLFGGPAGGAAGGFLGNLFGGGSKNSYDKSLKWPEF